MFHTNWQHPLETKTLPEAQRTQGIESITWMVFFKQNHLKSTKVRNMIQVIDSIPWVRCASGNVFFNSHKFQYWPPGGATCIATLPGIAHWHHLLVLSCYPHQPESHQLSLQNLLDWVSDWLTSGPIDRTPGTPGSDKNTSKIPVCNNFAQFSLNVQGRSSW